MCPVLLINARPIQAGVHDEVHGALLPLFHEPAEVLQAGNPHLNPRGDLFPRLPDPGQHRFVGEGADLGGFCERRYAKSICASGVHDWDDALRAMVVRIRLDHAHELGVTRHSLHHGGVVRNRTEVNGQGGGTHGCYCASRHPSHQMQHTQTR